MPRKIMDIQDTKDSNLKSTQRYYPLHTRRETFDMVSKLCHKLSSAKSKLNLLLNSSELNIFTSVKPKVGKKFINKELETQKLLLM